MAVDYNPTVVLPGLLVNYDFANPKSFVPTQNLLQYSQALATSPWAKIGTNVTITNNNALAPDGSLTATLFNTTTYVGGDSVYQDITASGTGTYTLSVYAKAGTATSINLSGFFISNTIQSFGVTVNLSTGVVTGGTGFTVSYPDGWYRIYVTSTGTNALNTNLRSQVYAQMTGTFYLWGAQTELNSSMNIYTATTSAAIVRSTNIIDTIGGYNMSDSYGNNAYYINTTASYMQFTRATAAPKDGGGASVTMSGSLTAANFLYNDYTWEVWFRIDNIQPGNTIWTGDATEGLSCLANYAGWHQGFQYTASSMNFAVVDFTTTGTYYNGATWTLGTSGTQIVQGNWYQIVITKFNRTYTPYLNGVPLGTGATVPAMAPTNLGTGNTVWIGKVNNAAAGAGSYEYYSRNSVANMKMYNRALSATEIAQNFQALRGRFGI